MEISSFHYFFFLVKGVYLLWTVLALSNILTWLLVNYGTDSASVDIVYLISLREKCKPSRINIIIIRIEEAKQREELLRLEKEHQKLLEQERKAKERRKVSKKPSKPTEEEQRIDKENLIDTIDTLINGQKPRKPKDLGWDYLKDKEAKRVFERKKELKRLRDEEKAKKFKNCLECRYPKHPGENCPCKFCGQKGHEMKDCPKLKPPPDKPQKDNFCTECMITHAPGRCVCKLCKTEGHLAPECPWLEIAAATIIPPEEKVEGEKPEVQICLHCRSTAHKMEDCAAYKMAQARLKEDWCYGCKQYGHTIVECMDEKQEERNKEIEKEIEEKKKQLKEIDRKVDKIKKQVEKDGNKEPIERDTRDYPKEPPRKPRTKPRKVPSEHGSPSYRI